MLDLGGESLVTLSYPNCDKASHSASIPTIASSRSGTARSSSSAKPRRVKLFGVPARVATAQSRRAVTARRTGCIASASAAAGGRDLRGARRPRGGATSARRRPRYGAASLDWPSDTQNYIARIAPIAAGSSGYGNCREHRTASPQRSTRAQRASVTAAHEQGWWHHTKQLQKRCPQRRSLPTGHAHIDLAWLWPYAETRRKMRRTFHTALGLMDGAATTTASTSPPRIITRRWKRMIPALLQQITAQGRGGQVGSDRRHVGRARHQHAHRRERCARQILVRTALFREALRQAPHRLLAARLLRLLRAPCRNC